MFLKKLQDCLNRFHQQRFLPYNGIVSVTNDIDDSLVGITEGEIPTLIFEEESIRKCTKLNENCGFHYHETVEKVVTLGMAFLRLGL